MLTSILGCVPLAESLALEAADVSRAKGQPIGDGIILAMGRRFDSGRVQASLIESAGWRRSCEIREAPLRIVRCTIVFVQRTKNLTAWMGRLGEWR